MPRFAFSPSAFIKAIDRSPEETFDEASVRALLKHAAATAATAADDSADEEWAAARDAAITAFVRPGFTATSPSSTHLTKQQLQMALCSCPEEVFDGRSGSRAEAQAVNAAEEAAGTPHIYALDVAATRAYLCARYVHSPKRRDMRVGGGDNLTLRFAVWTPSPEKWSAGPRGLYLLFHGGGWMYGDGAGQNDERLEAMCDELGLVVMAPDYRKAPEHPFPAALEDCEAAAAWVEANAVAEFGTNTLIMGGESAGGNLCAAVLLRRRDAHAAACTTAAAAGFPWRLVNFVYGVFDLQGTPSVAAFGNETARDFHYFCDSYCSDVRLRLTPDASPIRGDLAGLPPAVFTVGTEDSLIDDTLLMYAAWRAANNQAWLDVWPDGPHGVGHSYGAHADTTLGAACRARVHRRIDRFLHHLAPDI
jgi:acetyl esterase/lipase